jgi:Cu+-exporting ATPase
MKLVENAQNTKAPIQGYADKVSSVFVPVVVLLAIIDWIVWFSIVYSNPLVKKGSPNLSKF